MGLSYCMDLLAFGECWGVTLIMIIFYPYLSKGWKLLKVMGFIRFSVSQHCDASFVLQFLAGVAPNILWPLKKKS